jgi:hypothetical protein
MNKIEELCADKPVDEEHLYNVGEHLIIVSNEAAVRSEDGANIAVACTNVAPTKRSGRSRRTSQPSTHTTTYAHLARGDGGLAEEQEGSQQVGPT